MATAKQHTGQQAEQTACQYLQSQGLSLLEKNYSCPRGEIDLIMRDRNTVVFVEVRFRRDTRFGSGAETVDRRKQNKLLATAAHYLQQNPKAARSACRFDVISLTANDSGEQQMDWIADAFQAD
ncbi:YraN family protein [Kaarinaea lacus]